MIKSLHFKPTLLSYRLLQATSFWKNNYLILREFKHFPAIAIAAILFSLLAAVFEGITIGLISLFLSNFADPDNLTNIQTRIFWFDTLFLGETLSPLSRLYRVTALIFLAVWLRSSFVYLGNYYTSLSEINLTYRLRKQVFEQLQSLSLSFFAKKRFGELLNSLHNEINQIRSAFNIASIFISKGFTLIVYIVSMFWLSWQLTTASLLMFILLAIGLATLRKQVREASFESVRASQKFTSVSAEFISGIRTVKAFSSQNYERKRFYNAVDELFKANNKAKAAASLVQPLTEGVSTTILLIILAVAVTFSLSNKNLQFASILTFIFILLRLAPIVSYLNGAWAKLASFQGSLTSVKDLLRTDNKIYQKDGHIQFSGIKQAIEFRAVDFGYSTQNLVLHNITLVIKKGQTTALIGASGAGKSTLADLIPRFYDPTRGKVLIDGIDLRKFNMNSLRHKMAIVSQDTFIFNTSVRENITYGTENVDEAAVWEVARLANALEFILKLPEGFDTQLGDRGILLSGGQRQRIAIARALLRNPEILILDEATSALDSVSERLIQESLEKLSVGRTVIAIAHRLSTIVKADTVVVLEQGRIVEQGSYQELLEKRGKLWKYHQIQHEFNKAQVD
ncbi:heterocyst formation ABC transporter subunit HepA [Gloeocapsopsis dulcis]|uniref:ABC transporter ATP-binding protein n=1 Tax=Gloeocapsopsis dulcis AAB1 = 1H9 TaxID=1433147 RepID=A0A6N8FV37_9CHRO|nr:heterocyst formation ABC transporter subunit HepA [Gloeocapsopsis dulcis]MUL35816.1 ABC transporter ATP-binding protein [Gloeocapsopsis dulcis AAB1 = 1H9]WNN87717.1 ABC transporter ATP-binding protein [Gloeocapsopsis dulcis]